MLGIAGAALIVVLGAGAACAAPVRGTLALPAELKSGRRYMGYWRVDNGNVPIAPAPHRPETVVVLQGGKGEAPAAKTVTVEIVGLQVNPPLVVVGPGSVVELRNQDKIPHDLSVPQDASVMPLQRLTPGGVRRQKFNQPGGYLVRSTDHPHVALSVVVVDSPHFDVAEEKGGFRIADAPDGKGTLKVWSHGRWVHEEPVEVAGRPLELKIKVRPAGGKEAE